MTTDDVFAGLPGHDPERQRVFESEAAERWGTDAIDEAKSRLANFSRDQAAEFVAEHCGIAADLGRLKLAGAAPESSEVQLVVARHYAWILQSWTPDADAYRVLAQLYVDDERFRRNYDVHGDGTAEFLRDAIDVFADGIPGD